MGGIQSNSIGPFNHAGGQTANDPYAFPSRQDDGLTSSGCNWGGGSQWFGGKDSTDAQIYPFPIYYYARFLGAAYGDKDEYNSVKMKQWKICNLSDVKDGKKPSKAALDCINNKIIKLVVQIAIDIANEAKNQLKTVSGYNQLNKIDDLKLEDVLDKSSELWGIPPSGRSAKPLFEYYTGTKDVIKKFEDYYKSFKCPVSTPNVGEQMSAIDMAKAWISITQPDTGIYVSMIVRRP